MRIFAHYNLSNGSYSENLVEALTKYADVTVDRPPPGCHIDIFLSLSMGHDDVLLEVQRNTPNSKMVTYVWDCYGWIMDQDDRYDWEAYGRLIKGSHAVLTPSHGQTLRLKEHWDVDDSKVIRCYGQYFDHDNVRDGNYVCNAMREIPDRQLGWVDRACHELQIPYNHGGRKRGQTGRTWDEYKDFIAGASFIVCPWYEASTGGMSLLEGYNLGKEVLVCDSPYLGAKDYFGDRAHYYQPDYPSMKAKIKEMWENKDSFPSRPLEDKQEFCSQFSADKFAERLYLTLKGLL